MEIWFSSPIWITSRCSIDHPRSTRTISSYVDFPYACGSVCGHSVLFQYVSTNQCGFISFISEMQVPCLVPQVFLGYFSPYYFSYEFYNWLVKFLEICLGILIGILLNLYNYLRRAVVSLQHWVFSSMNMIYLFTFRYWVSFNNFLQKFPELFIVRHILVSLIFFIAIVRGIFYTRISKCCW